MLGRLAKALRPALLDAARAALDAMAGRSPATRPPRQPRRRTRRDTRPTAGGQAEHAPAPEPYPGDYTGPVAPVYAPHDDDVADPGEVVWAWVPYEEDHSRGKDRPVLVIGHDGPWLLALPLTSKDHDRDATQESRAGRHWIDVGTGPWDRRGRSSEARVDRVVRIAPASVRRLGARLDAAVFEEVAAAARR